ncbi:septation protein IspZ [Amylibacter sp. SFDW26]|uniref:inner membrane-spanning protein YciB n=1 Tax=Amylibacter sp. SFDW26 TaxID=2652722 RepID=UPI00126290CF|nr:inner membrane-spanning protein YciB [Amylibacter sp. SFDW26]KAB7615508.1 septation protein IspZ [Amylibacter sp. SFDW26]
MEEKKISSGLKMVLELGPVVLFFIAYTKMKDNVYTVFGQEYEGFIIATAGFIPVLLVCTGIVWALTGKLSKMQLMTAVLVVVFGGMSVWFNDERFFKMKPTIIYILFGGILAFGLMRGQSYLKAVMEEAMPLQDEGWMILTKRICMFFFVLAVMNEFVWRTMSTDAWVNFKTFGLTAAIFLFFMTQGGVLAKYGLDKDKN